LIVSGPIISFSPAANVAYISSEALISQLGSLCKPKILAHEIWLPPSTVSSSSAVDSNATSGGNVITNSKPPCIP